MTGEDQPNELALMVLWHGSECLIQHRTHKKEGGIGFWGGRVKLGEEPFNAAIREVGEEISEEVEGWLRVKDAVKPMGDEIESDGWQIHAFQALLRYDNLIKKTTEGAPLVMSPRDMWEDERLMSASRAVIKEFIMKPNGLIDN